MQLACNQINIVHSCVYIIMNCVSVTAVPKKLVLRIVSIDRYEATVGWHVADDGGSVITSFSFFYIIYNSTSTVQPEPINLLAGEVQKNC